MNKKPGLLFSICLLAMIVLATSFGMNFGGNPPLKLPNGINPDTVLYVCPVKDSVWDGIATSLSFLSRYAYIFFFFAGMVLLFSWGWALYQNLLKDKFNVDAYKNSWTLTKAFFWTAICFTILFVTPNHFRRVDVHLRNGDTQMVLCENTSTGAKPIKYGAVTFR